MKIQYLHLLNLPETKDVSFCAWGLVKSSKLTIKSDISSASERIGAITSEHKNFDPVNLRKNKN